MNCLLGNDTYLKALIEELKNLIILLDAIKVSNKKDIKLSSGGFSDFYVDFKRVALTGKGAQLLGRIFYELYHEKSWTEKINIVGRELGAVPIVTAVSMYFEEMGYVTRSIIVKKQVKDHGVAKWIEGYPFTDEMDRPVADGIIIDDVLTTGATLDLTYTACLNSKIDISHIFVVVDREESGMTNTYENNTVKIPLISIFKKSDFAVLEGK